MTKELYSVKSKKTELSVTNNTISAIQKADTVKTGLRIYDNDCIGIAGVIGAYDENKLEGKAKQMLKFNIPYDCRPSENLVRSVDLTNSFQLSDEDFVRLSEELLSSLSKLFPRFAFSHKILCEEVEKKLSNSRGTDLCYRDKRVEVQLLIKNKGSKNLIDSFGATVMRGFDPDAIFKSVAEVCACYDEKVEAPESKMPVIMLFGHQTVLQKFFTDLSGRAMGTAASMFSDKLGQKLFADSFALNVDRNPLEQYRCFFDTEGTVLPGDSFPLVENGVLKSPYSTKKLAKQYGYAVTGSSAGDYDSVPEVSPESIGVLSSGKTINQLLNGRKAVYMVFASGGDFTAQGEFASPVQSAFLYENGNLLGRLPQLSISSDVYRMFGEDFIGLSTDGNNPHAPFKFLAMEMNVAKIGDWF